MKKTLHIHILEYPDAMASAIYGVRDLFQIANYQADAELFVCHTLTPNTRLKTKFDNVVFVPPCLSKELPSFSDTKTLTLLKKWNQSNAVLVAACAGVFWLANANLLAGKQVTTHWLLFEKLMTGFPAIKSVNRSDMVVDQGNIITAGGLYAFQDLALHLIARYAGFALAKKVADFSLLDLKGRLQTYYQRFYPQFDHDDQLIIKAQKYCEKTLYDNLSNSQLADHCHISQRSLLRRFKAATGYSPAQYLIQLKIEKAKELMETRRLTTEEIGYKLGYTDASNFIRVFKKVTDITPAEFKSRRSV